jgi:hypothetical protein
VGDDPAHVAENRRRLESALQLPSKPLWLTQVHGTGVADAVVSSMGCEGDASISHDAGRVCAVLTADCLPLLLTDRAGKSVAAVHAGWRGLAAGVIEAAVRRLNAPSGDLLAWLGPAIGPETFEVGKDVMDAFASEDSAATDCFRRHGRGRWFADIYGLARLRLSRVGVGFVGGGEYCTVSDASRFYSYRRDGVTGRMASLIWIEE